MACVMVSRAMPTLSRLTGSPSHLYRAAMFAEWCLSFKERECRVPDRPLSLGVAWLVFMCEFVCVLC